MQHISRALAALLLLGGCAAVPHAERPDRGRPLIIESEPFGPVDAASVPGLSGVLAGAEVQRVGAYVGAVRDQELAVFLSSLVPPPAPVVRETVVVAMTSWPSSLYPCGGDLPPCYVKQRESGGDYNAQNPTSSASGAWQFLDSTWAGFGGYARAVLAPPEVQDEKARLLWAGGAGCSHWSAC